MRFARSDGGSVTSSCPVVDEEVMGAGVGWERTLLRLSLNERSSIHSVRGERRPSRSLGLDARTHALVSLGALVALGAPPTSYDCAVDAARAAGATPEDIVGVLVAVLTDRGSRRAAARPFDRLRHRRALGRPRHLDASWTPRAGRVGSGGGSTSAGSGARSARGSSSAP